MNEKKEFKEDVIPETKSPLERADVSETAFKSPLERADVSETAFKSPLERGFRGVLNSIAPYLHSKSFQKSNKRAILPYNPSLKELARKLRNNSTKSEIHLWSVLKGKYLHKFDFQRQKPLGDFIADFYCYELDLVIELDGYTHKFQDTIEKDIFKEKSLNSMGLNVLRFSDEQVLENIEGVMKMIDRYIDAYEKINSITHPCIPSQEGT